MSPAREKMAVGLTTAILAIGLRFAIVPPAARAAERWGVLGSFGRAPGDPEPLSGPQWLAVDQSTGEVYVTDNGNDRVERFSAAGAYLGQFNGSGSYEVEGKHETGAPAPTGALLGPEGIAVDSDPSSPSFGDVYVVDESHRVIDKFDALGAYLGQITGTCPFHSSCRSSETVPFTQIEGVAVNQNGVVWVENGHQENPAIDSFGNGQPNAFLSTVTAQTGALARSGMAVDANDDLYLFFEEGDFVVKINSVGEVVGERPLGGEETKTGIAVDPSSNDAYIDNGEAVSVLEATGPLVEAFGSGSLSGAGALAVSPTAGASGYAYVIEPADSEIAILEHSDAPPPPPPAPTTGTATGITAASATLHGELNPEGAAGGVGYHFSYNAGEGASCTGPGSTGTPLDNGGSNLLGNTKLPVSATVTGLEPNVDYVYCLVADRFGATPASAESFTMLSLPPAIGAVTASSTSSEEDPVNLEASINPENEETTYHFEYSTAGSVSENKLEGSVQSAPEEPFPTLSPGFGEQEISPVGIPLVVTKTVYYRLVAANQNGGTTTSHVQAYTKLPLVEHESIANLTSTSVSLKATVNPVFINGTKYAFEYATEAAALGTPQATVVDKAELPAEEPPVSREFPVETEITGLQPGETYYYRVVARNLVSETKGNANKGQPVAGATVSFKPFAAPAVSTGDAQDITATSAALLGEVNPEGAPTSYCIVFMTESGYLAAVKAGVPNPYAEGETTSCQAVAAGESMQTAGPVFATGLRPGTPYDYAVVATNRYGLRTSGRSLTFTTAAGMAPSASTGAASSVGETTATLSGAVDTNGLASSYGFEIGTSPGNPGPATGLGTLPPGSSAESVQTTMTGLQPGTTYYYRVIATSSEGTGEGLEESFTTASAPSLLTLPMTPVALSYTPPLVKEVKVTSSTPAQKLHKALTSCRKRYKRKSRRQRCESAAKKRYKAEIRK